jgi:Ser/Thr protein kinase RdoA (MazF antagonist)
MEKIMEFDFKSILTSFGVYKLSNITQIYSSAWSVGSDYVLKASDNQGMFDKSIRLSRLLLLEDIPVIEYIDTTEGKPYVFADDKYWCLMKRIKGTVFNPFVGEPKQNGVILGRTVAELHQALKRIEDEAVAPNADFHHEFISWILPELEKGGISFTDGLIDSLHTFFKLKYKSLPRQLIHRDMHTSNLLFENGKFSYLDFDLCQRNVRVFDLVYLGCSLLVENYNDEVRLKQWRELFSGILQGYSELIQLNSDEMNAIPSLFLFDEVLFTAFYLRIGQPETAKNCMVMTNWMYENIGKESVLG